MIHFLYLTVFAAIVSTVFGAFTSGSSRERIRIGVKTFLQFMIVSLVLAWVLYFIPW